jgi:hypothetical protein
MSLPPELLYQILDFIRDDLCSLKQCVLVCRAFLPKCQSHIFSVIRFTHPYHARQQCQSFYHLISSNPDITTHVRELHISCDLPSPNEFPVGTSFWAIEEAALPEILRMVHRLEFLSLGSRCLWLPINWDHFTPELHSALLDRFRAPCLTTLRVCHIMNFPVDQLHTFTHIKNLIYLGRSLHRVTLVSPKNSVILPPQLQTLGMSGHPEQEFFVEALIRPMSLISHLRRFTVYDGVGGMLDHAWTVMKAAANTIEHFSWIDPSSMYRYLSDLFLPNFNCYADHQPISLWPIDLSAMSALRTISFHFFDVGNAPAMVRGQIQVLLDHSAVCGKLEKLSVIIEAGFHDRYPRREGPGRVWMLDIGELTEWTDLDNVLGLHVESGMTNFPSTEIELYVKTTDHRYWADDLLRLKSKIAESMPRLAAKGAIKVGLLDADTYSM